MKQLIVVRAVQTCGACPAQWDAWTDTGQYLYLRFRWGTGTVDAYPSDNEGEWGHVPEGRLAWFEVDDPMLGEITLEEFCERAGIRLELKDETA